MSGSVVRTLWRIVSKSDYIASVVRIWTQCIVNLAFRKIIIFLLESGSFIESAYTKARNASVVAYLNGPRYQDAQVRREYMQLSSVITLRCPPIQMHLCKFVILFFTCSSCKQDHCSIVAVIPAMCHWYSISVSDSDGLILEYRTQLYQDNFYHLLQDRAKWKPQQLIPESAVEL